jgi:AraC-like DNA-binding protein
MSKTWLMNNWTFVYSLSYFLPLLYGPLIFLFTRQVLSPQRTRFTVSLHFVPFALGFLYLMLEQKFDFFHPVINALFRRESGMLVQLASITIYHALAILQWRRHKTSLKNYFSETHRLQVNWIRQLVISSLIVCAIIAVALYLIYVHHPKSLPYRYWFAVLTVFIYWVSYTALVQPSIFTVIKGYAKEEMAVSPEMPRLVIHRSAKKYSNSGLSNDDILSIQGALKKVTLEQKPYLNPELTINHLAAMIPCNRHQLSQVLNEALKNSFYDYINYYRVEEAKQLLMHASKENYKISSIAYDAGFNSLSTFNEVFRKHTGTTPSQFRKDLHEVSKQRHG